MNESEGMVWLSMRAKVRMVCEFHVRALPQYTLTAQVQILEVFQTLQRLHKLNECALIQSAQVVVW